MQRLLNFLVGLRKLPPLSELSGDEERMLFELRSLWERRGGLTVADAYDLGAGSSSITSYRRLVALKDKGLVDITVMESDRRKRKVEFTETAEELFSRLAQ